MRLLAACLVLTLALPVAQAGDEGLAGNWKISVYEDGQPASLVILRLEKKKGEWSATSEPLRRFPPTKVTGLKVGDKLSFSLKMEDGFTFDFEGNMPKAGGKRILGSLSRGNTTVPAVLEATAAKNEFELDRELVTRFPNDPRVFGAVLGLLGQAKANQAAAADVKDWIETALAASEPYGPRWKHHLGFRLFGRLVDMDAYAAIAADLGKNLDKGLDPKASDDLRLLLWEMLATSLRRAGQAEQAKAYDGRADALIDQGHAAHLKKEEFPVEKFKGRKSKSKRAVMVELFTGSQCPPCVGADMGFDGLGRTYKSADVVLLQYHLHYPGPDALTNADTEARKEFYNRSYQGTPAIFFNGKHAVVDVGGKATPLPGGFREDAEDLYRVYRKEVEKLLEKAANIEVEASAVRQGDKVQIQATVRNIEAPSKDLRLRLALVEDWVRYKARNGLTYHHRVVRALPGGPDGVALTKKEVEKSVVVDLGELRKKLHKYLDQYEAAFLKENPDVSGAFPDTQRPMRLRDLHVVAFVQNDESGEVLHAVDVAVKKGEE